ncbi:hypothetical protein GIB67_000016 [Kingdonia uniflora]|uniref:CBS domain-containing protein n=1 Tax=Kingdonia uniflora TaxID=39325 RepID=A0A7J7MNU8_9MAGN|nr:hypothetical protein GIB67_000016 [Kingdonia uniflora]
MDEKRATAFGLMKIDEEGCIIEFAEKPKGEQLKAMKFRVESYAYLLLCVSNEAYIVYTVFVKNPAKIKNYGIWLRYQSRTGYHNMYKEYRDTTLNGSVEKMYTELASRHRVRFPCIQIIKTTTIPAKLCKRESTKQFHKKDIKFPQDIATRVIARELNVDETPISKVMTRNPIFVLSGTLAVEALQKMVLGKFRHLPVVENGEVIALLDIAKCLYDAIARMERAAEKGKAIAAAVECVERHWGNSVSGPNSFIETLRDRMFRPYLSTIIQENSKMVTVSPTDSVLSATQKMLELCSKDLLMRVIAQNLSPESTLVEKVFVV